MGVPTGMLVAVTQRVDRIADRDETRDGLDQRLLQWLVQSGFVPVPVPNGIADPGATTEAESLAARGRSPLLDDWLRSVRPAGLVLSGGNNIGAHADRDATERYLLSWARSQRVPVLGICRGLQMMATWAGGTLVEIAGHVRCRHPLAIDRNPDHWPDQVNSFHDWGLASCPAGFTVAARANDGVIEALVHDDLPWEGWMWHPEREQPFAPRDTRRLRALFGQGH